MLTGPDRIDLIHDGVRLLLDDNRSKRGNGNGARNDRDLASAKFAAARRGLKPGHQLWELAIDLEHLLRRAPYAPPDEE